MCFATLSLTLDARINIHALVHISTRYPEVNSSVAECVREPECVGALVSDHHPCSHGKSIALAVTSSTMDGSKPAKIDWNWLVETCVDKLTALYSLVGFNVVILGWAQSLCISHAPQYRHYDWGVYQKKSDMQIIIKQWYIRLLKGVIARWTGKRRSKESCRERYCMIPSTV